MVWWRATCAIMVLMAVPFASAQLAEDDAGDHEVTVGGAVPITGTRWNALDLLALDVDEQSQAFEFTLNVDDLAPPGEDTVLVDGIDWFVHFSYRGAEYRINLYRVGNAPAGSGYFYGATLDQYDAGSQRWALLEFYEVTIDPAEGTLTVLLPRDHIVGADGAGALKGGSLEKVFVTSSLFMEAFVFELGPAGEVPYPIQGSDRMPDDGMLQIPIELGISQDGTASLHSDAPVRVSNGEATTMLFTMTARNGAEEQQSFQLVAKDVPDEWTVTFPVERLRLDGGESAEVPVLVTTPFNHEHGLYRTMMVELQSQHDPDAVGRAELGIRYTATPQPAGHHDTVYIHIDAQGRPYFNTVEDDPGDVGLEARANSGCSCSGESIDRFNIPLLPGLLMGLDFDLDRTGTLDIPIRFDQPAMGVMVRGEIGVYEGTDGRRDGFFNEANERAVAQLAPAGPFDFEAGETKQITLSINGTTFGDYLPYEQDSAMILHLDVAVPAITPMCCLVEPSPALLSGGRMELPLDEYHDDVDEYFSSLTGVDLYATQRQHAMVNPGKVVVFNATLENIGETAGRYDLSLTGNHADWARILGTQQIGLSAGAQRELAVAVTVPDGARDGDQADIVLHAVSVDDDNVRTLIRFVAEVDQDAEHGDQADLAESLDGALSDDKQSPSPWLAGVALLGAAAWLRRRW